VAVSQLQGFSGAGEIERHHAGKDKEEDVLWHGGLRGMGATFGQGGMNGDQIRPNYLT
jgi:hypothetical protein